MNPAVGQAYSPQPAVLPDCLSLQASPAPARSFKSAYHSCNLGFDGRRPKAGFGRFTAKWIVPICAVACVQQRVPLGAFR